MSKEVDPNQELGQSQTYHFDEVLEATKEYFNNDELATQTFFKYVLNKPMENDVVYYEKTPDDMHHRMAKEFTRIENNYSNPSQYDEIKKSMEYFKYIVPQGSPMYGIGNPYSIVSLSNCVVVESPKDNMSSIFDTAKKSGKFI
jgi:ribonucleoside-diphosphate reductase alpha chain